MNLLFLATITVLGACLIGQVMPKVVPNLHTYVHAHTEEEEGFLFEKLKLKAQDVELVNGLSWSFYEESCPNLERIVRTTLKPILAADITQAAGILRLHFHDCFVQGCDASVLLEGSESEQSAIPNLTLRSEAFEIINTIKANVEALCPNVVSCADILTIAARDSVSKAKGPHYPVPLGRRDSLSFANNSITIANLPPPTANVTGLMDIFSTKGLDLVDLVALSGGHTIGRAHCPAFASRLDPLDANLDPELASNLTTICPMTNSTNFTNMDTFTPNQFDNNYYKGLVRSYGLFTSDSSLVLDSRTNATVESFYSNQSLFFEQFGLSMIKMGQLEVLNGTEGAIRTNCSVVNSASLISTFQTAHGDLSVA